VAVFAMRTLLIVAVLEYLVQGSILDEKVLESVASGAVQLSLDGTLEQVEVAPTADFNSQKPFWKKAQKYDDEVEKTLDAANLSKDERAEVEKNLDELLNHTNVSALVEAFSKAALVQSENHTVALRNKSGSVTVKGTDPKLKTLNEQHDNLTRLVHGQADVVAHTSASLTRNNEEINKQELEVAHAGDLYDKAHGDSMRAEKALKDHLVALAIAKKRRDDLKRKADEAQRVLEQVGPQYNAAQYHLDILMSKTPGLKDHAKSKVGQEDKMEEALEGEEKKRKDMQAKLAGDDAALQAAIAKLNGLNTDLKRIEDKIEHWNAARPCAAAAMPLLLVILGFSGQI